VLCLLLVTGPISDAGSFVTGGIAIPFILTQAQLIAAWAVFSRRRRTAVWLLAVGGEVTLWLAMTIISGSWHANRAAGQSIAIQAAVVAIGLGLARIRGTRLSQTGESAPPAIGRPFQFSLGQVLVWTAVAAIGVAMFATPGSEQGGSLRWHEALVLAIPAVLSAITVRAMLADAPAVLQVILPAALTPVVAFLAGLVFPPSGSGRILDWIYFLCLLEQQTVTIPTLLAVRASGYRLVNTKS